MGQALSIAIREQIVSLRASGSRFVDISQELNLPYDTVRKLHKQLLARDSMSPRYSVCGHKGQLRCSYFFYRACLWLKRHHVGWGAPFIRLKLQARYGEAALPSVRQMQVWFRAKGLNSPRQRHPKKKDEPTVAAPHDRWQVDAKEQLKLANGQDCCYLSIVDEQTGAALGAPLFPL